MCVGSIDSCALDRSLASGRAFVNCKCRNTHSRCIALLRRSVSQCSNDIGREACPGFCLESVATCESKNSFRHGQTAGRRLVTRQSSAQQAWVCTCVYRVSTSGCRRHVVRVVESGQPAVCVCVSIYIYIYIYYVKIYDYVYIEPMVQSSSVCGKIDSQSSQNWFSCLSCSLFSSCERRGFQTNSAKLQESKIKTPLLADSESCGWVRKKIRSTSSRADAIHDCWGLVTNISFWGRGFCVQVCHHNLLFGFGSGLRFAVWQPTCPFGN